ncbi:MAG: hypothetical protein KG003_03260 [Bacteroidetes bacterium]|nr:hypothetical protein [Bacteroidota bacterium]
MKFCFAFLLAIFFTDGLFAQNNTLNFEEKTYKIYPYRMDGVKYYSLYEATNADIPYYPMELEDGKYAVMFTKKTDLLSPKNKKQLEWFESWPAAICNIKNGKKEGPVVFYSKYYKKEKHIVSGKGYYSAGKKDGRWVFYTISSFKGNYLDSTIIHFKGGLPEGEAVQGMQGNIYEAHGYYKNGVKSGLWNIPKKAAIYYENGLIHGAKTDSSFRSVTVTHYFKGNPFGNVEFYDLNGRKTAEIKVLDTNAASIPGLEDSAKFYVRYSELNDNTEMSSTNFTPAYLRALINNACIFKSNYNSDNWWQVASDIGPDWRKYLSHSKYIITMYKTDGSVLYEYPCIGAFIRVKPGNYLFEYKKGYYVYEDLNYPYLPEIKEKKKIKYVPNPIEYSVTFDSSGADRSYWKIKSTSWDRSYERSLLIRNYRWQYLDYHGLDREYNTERWTWSGRYVGQNILLEDSTVYRAIDAKYICSKEYNLISKNGWTKVEVNSGNHPDLVANRILKITGNPQLYSVDSGWVFQSYSSITNKKHRVEFITTDTIRPNKNFHFSLSNFNRIYPQFQYPGSTMPLIYLDGELYTGEVKILSEFNKDKDKDRIQLKYIIRDFWGFKDTSKVLSLKREIYGVDYIRYTANKGLVSGMFQSTENEMVKSQYYTQGIANGVYRHQNGQEILLSNQYKNGVPNGPQWMYSGQPSNEYDHKNTVISKNTNYQPSQHFFVDRGTLNGPAMQSSNSNIVTYLNFKNDSLNGLYLKYQNDLLLDSLSFVSNLPNGTYHSYYGNEELNSKLKPRVFATFDHGRISDSVIAFFKDDGISSIARLNRKIPIFSVSENWYGNTILRKVSTSDYYGEKDTFIPELMYRNYGKKQLNYTVSGSSFLTIIPGLNFDLESTRILEFEYDWDANYTYYYKGGIKSMEGEIRNQQRTGWWHFYTESGKKYKSILYNFKDSMQSIPENAKNGKGYCKGFDDFGRLSYEGFIMDTKFTATCATNATLTFEDLYYTGVYDSMGNNLLMQNKPVRISEKHITGAKNFDGWWYQGKRDSIWYFYSSNGLLNSAGKYQNGVKEGRWISGDLAGINALDNSCFAPGEEWRIMGLLKELDFTETYYDSGVVVFSNFTEVQTDGFTRNNYRFQKFKKVQKPSKVKRIFKKIFSKKRRYKHHYTDF